MLSKETEKQMEERLERVCVWYVWECVCVCLLFLWVKAESTVVYVVAVKSGKSTTMTYLISGVDPLKLNDINGKQELNIFKDNFDGRENFIWFQLLYPSSSSCLIIKNQVILMTIWHYFGDKSLDEDKFCKP